MARRKKPARTRAPRRSGLAAFEPQILEQIIRPRVEATGSKGFSSIRGFCKQFCADHAVDVSEKTFREWLTRLGIAIGPVRLTLTSTTHPDPGAALLPTPPTARSAHELETIARDAHVPQEGVPADDDDDAVFDKGPIADARIVAPQVKPGVFQDPTGSVVGGLMPPG